MICPDMAGDEEIIAAMTRGPLPQAVLLVPSEVWWQYGENLATSEVGSQEQGKVMTASDIIREKREEILAIARKHCAFNVRVFGSVARGEADEKSDIDLLVDLDADRSLFDLGALVVELNESIGRHVDVITERGIRQRIRDRIIREAVAL
jgi:predicted nucleotidyltransferase